MKRESGIRGQNEFLGWCEPEQFHAQRSEPDRLGWDFLLEADPERPSDTPLDQQNELPKFLVQVKATEHATAVPRIKLSALKHLVDSDLPAAIAVLFYSKGGRRSIRRLIVPVDESLISITLRLVREQEARGNRAIHTRTVQIPIERAIEIGPEGSGLSAALYQMLQGTFAEYITRKIHFRSTCGFDIEPMVGRFFVPGVDAQQKLGELFLGRRRELEVNDLTIERRRFGIPLRNDQLYFRDAIIEMDAQPLLSASIELASSAGEWMYLPVDVFVMPPFADDHDHLKIRLANKFLELILDFEKERVDVTFDYSGNREVGLEDAVAIIEAGAIFARPNKTLIVHFKDHRMELPTAIDEGPFWNWIPVAPVLRRICLAVQRSSHCPQGTLKLGTFLDWVDEHKELLAVASMPGVNLIFSCWPEDGIVDGQPMILTPMSVEVAGLQYTALVEIPIVSTSRDEKEVRIVGGQPCVLEEVIRLRGADTSDFIELAVEATRRRRNIIGPILVAGGIERWESDCAQDSD